MLFARIINGQYRQLSNWHKFTQIFWTRQMAAMNVGVESVVGCIMLINMYMKFISCCCFDIFFLLNLLIMNII